MEALAEARFQRRNSFEETQTGLLLLIVGVIVSAIPIVRFVGSLVSLGAILLLVRGRQPFGPRHYLHLKIGSMVLTIGAALLTLASVGFIFLIPTMDSAQYPSYGVENVLPWALVGAIPAFLFMELAGSIFAVAGYGILTYSLQGERHRLLLWLGFLASLATSLTIYSILSPAAVQLGQHFGVFVDPGSGITYYDWDLPSAYAFEAQLFYLGLLNVVPAVVFAFAYRSSHSRLDSTIVAETLKRLGLNQTP